MSEQIETAKVKAMLEELAQRAENNWYASEDCGFDGSDIVEAARSIGIMLDWKPQ